VVKNHNQVDGCKVGFLPAVYLDKRRLYVDKRASVVELLSESDDPRSMKYSKDNCGVAVWEFLDDDDDVDTSRATDDDVDTSRRTDDSF
jgi:hypothetical protein